VFGLGPFEIITIGAIAVMLYGKRLPEVGRTVGKSLADLRRQWATISRDLDVAGHLDASPGGSVRPPQPPSRFDDEESGTTGPVFEAPPQSPTGS